MAFGYVLLFLLIIIFVEEGTTRVKGRYRGTGKRVGLG